MTLPRDPASNAARIRQLLAPVVAACGRVPVFLVDGDRTLSPDDTSRTFLRRAGLDPMAIKQRFERDGYCFDAFRFHAEVHVALGTESFDRLAPEVAAAVPLHEGAVDFLCEAERVGHVFVVSAGIPAIWRAILERHGLTRSRVVGGIDPRLPYVLGRAEKALVAEMFLEQGAIVIGVGDSDVDTEMLRRSHHAVVVMNHRGNVDLLPHLADHGSLWQVSPCGRIHPGIPILDFVEITRLAMERSPCH